MLPITLNPQIVRIGLAGAGEGLERRTASLQAAGAQAEAIAPDSGDAGLRGLSLLLIAGLDRSVAAELGQRARTLGVLVNVEDIPEISDFHMPAIVRRGDLTVAISTGGRVPGLARRLRVWLEERIGPEWAGRIDTLAAARESWRANGLSPHEVSRRTRELISMQGWL